MNKFTESQLEAIDAGNMNILVSAAAGSGKSTVLCERIRKKIVSGERDIGRLLVMSFNNESADDLRDKLTKILAKEYEERKETRLLRQSLLVEKAAISTIHGFNYSLVKENFNLLGLSPDISVANENEMDELKKKIMDDVIADFYRSDSEFTGFTDVLVSDRDNYLGEIFISIYEKVMNEPLGIELIDKNCEELRSSASVFDSSKWGRFFRENIDSALDYFGDYFSGAADSYEDYGEKGLHYAYAFRADYAKSLRHSSSLCEMKCMIDERPTFPKFQKIKGCEEQNEHYKDVADDFVDFLGKIVFDYDNIGRDFEATLKYNSCLSRVLKEFNDRFVAEKKKRGEIDFGDMERMAYSLLVEKNGGPTELAREYRARFDEVYVDEYQDTNAIQNAIIRAISDNNLFIVGDIKQSIYGFRGACPNIFSSYRKNGFGNIDKSKEKTVFLSENFRSDENVLKFSNGIFSKIMPKVDSIGYVDKDNLCFAKKEDTLDNKVELRLFSSKDADENSDQDMIDESEYVARRIKKLIDDGTKPKEIAVITRKFGNAQSKLMDRLKTLGVPFSTKKEDEFFSRAHVLLTLCLLETLDNPRRDVYLVGLLRSDIFSFSGEELLRIRIESKQGCFYDALRHYGVGGNDPALRRKVNTFLEFFGKEQNALSGMSLDEFVRTVCDDCSLISILCFGKSESEVASIKSDIAYIYSLAREIRSRSNSGLSYFVRYLDEMKEKGIKIGNKSSDENSVRIMTIHASKGLQFNHCFVFGIGSLFRTVDKVEGGQSLPISYDREFGTAMKIPHDDGKIENKSETLLLSAIKKKHNIEIVEEEMRLFYVALTRAIHNLVITGSSNTSSIKKQFAKQSERPDFPYTKYEAYAANSFLKWTIACLENIPGDCFEYSLNPTFELSEGKSSIEENTKSADNRSRLDILSVDYKYKYSAMIPAKLSVSRLTPDVLDGVDDTAAGIRTSGFDGERVLPSFMLGREEAKANEIGTATHEFMQFCNFGNAEKNGVSAEKDRLVAKGFLSEKKAGLIRLGDVEGFFSSVLYGRMKNASEMHREMRFNIKLPAIDFTRNPERAEAIKDDSVLVQGVIDCVFKDENGNIILVDYKTDRFGKTMEREKIESELRNRYESQLYYYTLAIEKLFGKRPSEVLLYSFALCDTVKLA